MRTLSRAVLPLLTISVAVPSILSAQQAEGVLRMRVVTVDPTSTPELDHLSPDELLALPTSRLLALQTPDGDSLADVELETFTIKGHRIRLDEGDGSDGYTVMDLDRRSYLAVQTSARVYVEWSGDSADAFYADADAASDSADAGLRENGRTRTINGFQTAGWEARDEDGITVAWLSSRPTNLSQFFTELARATRTPAGEDGEGPDAVMTGLTRHGFPVMIQTLEMAGGKPVGAYVVEEVLSWDPRPVSDDLFGIPAGYRRGTVQDLIRGDGPD